MGIRFYCPNGHKLNVKTFLAGKRGICPKCGAKFEIPLESVRAPSERMTPAGVEPLAAAGAAGIANQPPTAALASPMSAAVGVADPLHAPAAGAPAPMAMPQPASGLLGRPFAPLNPVNLNPANVQPAQAFSPGGFPSAVPANFGGASMAAMRESAPAASIAPGAAASAADPIAEAPAAVWYVRPASGGQFGPAAGDVMRQWLMQRRVGADSMIWREGWADWKRAAAVFPSLAPSTAASAASPQGAAAASSFADDDDWVEALIDTKPAVAPRAIANSRSKGKQNNTIVIVSFFLILLCVLLAVVIVTVYVQQNKSPDSSSSMLPPRAAPAAVRLADTDSIMYRC